MHIPSIQCTCITSVGRVRSLNEDAFCIRPDIGLWMVADGMGGHSKGDIASQLACEEIANAVSSGATVTQAIQGCHQTIQLKGFQNKQLRGMGTTVVCASAKPDAIEIFWVGDSRAYMWREAQLVQLTKDHSVVQNLLDIGEISPAQALQHPKKHIITQSVGAEMITDLAIGHVATEVKVGDRLLLCSDGLHDLVALNDINELFNQNLATNHLLELLVGRANELGGYDNITALILEFAAPIDST